MLVNELKVIPVYKLERVAVGDPTVADVSVLSAQELMVIAKKPGTTNLLVWDKLGERAFKLSIFEKDLEKVAQKIRGLLAASDISTAKVKLEDNSIYIMGEALTENELNKVKDILGSFPNTVNLFNIKERQPLIEIDVDVLEVGYDDLKDLGFDWSNSLPVRYSEPTEDDGDAPKLWKVLSWDRTSIDSRLNFLIQDNKARTLANPKLVTLSGKEASFLVGGEVPYVTVETEGRTRVGWKEYGVNLKILPLVNAKNEIKLRLEAEVADLDWTNAVEQQGYSIPAFKKRQAKTELFLNEEDTIFIAGLIKNEDVRDVERLPWLSTVPVLGEFFKTSQFKNKRTELVISITPRIIGEKANPGYISEETLKQEAIQAAQVNAAYSEETSPLTYYTQMIEDIIARGAVYPENAREGKQEGIVKIDLQLLPDGQLKAAKIKQSSGSSDLDKAALNTVQALSPYPSFPAQITQKELRLTVPVVFKNYAKNE